jgi:signal transduction histidine kinase
LIGLKKTDLAGRKSTDITAEYKKTNPEFFDVFTRVAATGKTEEFETYIKSMDTWLSVKAYSQKTGYFSTVIEDITEQKHTRQRLEDYSQGLELTVAERSKELSETHERLLKAERFAAIGELAGMVGHDLRNPLTSIKNAAYYLNRKLNMSIDPKEKTMFDVIDKSVEHANKIIGNLLEYSREITLEIEECTPKSLVDYVLLMTQIPENVKVRDRTIDYPTMWVDTNKIERVFINLIKNAVDAMPQGGTIDIASSQVGDSIEFTFADTGMGMTEQTKSRIFTPLFTTKAQGMGFGLAICRRIIEAHCGKIEVESVLGKGTKFTIALPVEQEFKIRQNEEFSSVPPQDSCALRA